MATQNPSERGNLEDLPREELMSQARNLGIEGRARMSKEELIRAIRQRQGV